MDLAYLRQHPKVRLYLARVKREVLDDTMHRKITDEILTKVNEAADAAAAAGAAQEEAISKALVSCGKASKAGQKYNRRYKLAYYDSHYVRRFFYNCIGLITVLVFLIVFSNFITMPYPYMLLLLTVTAALSAWLTFKRFLKPIYFVLNIFMVPVIMLYTVFQNIPNEIKLYNAKFDFGDVPYPFVFDFSPYTIQFTTAAVLAATGIFVTLWLYSDAYFNARQTKYVKAGIAILTAFAMTLSMGFNTKNRQYLELKAQESSATYWTALRASVSDVDQFEQASIPVDFPIYVSLSEMDEILSSYIKTYGKPISYKTTGTANSAAYLRSIQDFLNKSPASLVNFKGTMPNFTAAQRITLVREFFDKLETERQHLYDYKEENSSGLFAISTTIRTAYEEFLTVLKQKQLEQKQN